MPFNGAGTFTRLFNWTADAGNNLPISATKFDGEDNDFASGFGNCLTRDGQGAPTAPLTWSQPLTINVAADGTDLAVGRTGGANNPQLQLKLADATGATLNLSTAQQLALAINGTNAISIAGTRAVTLASPTSGIPLTVNALASGQAISITDGTHTGGWYTGGGPGLQFGSNSNDPLTFYTNGITRLTLSATGNLTLATPTSGIGETINCLTGNQALRMTDGTRTADFYITSSAGQEFQFGTTTNHGALFFTNNSGRVAVAAAGNVTISAPTAAPSLTLGETSGVVTTLVLGAAGGFATAIKLLGSSAGQGRNWLIGNQNNALNALEFTPSTANGGSTFTTPAMTISGAGNIVVAAPSSGTGITVQGGGIVIGSPINGGGYLDIGAANPVLRVQSTGAAQAISELFATNTLVGIDANWGTTATPFSIRMGGASGTDCINVSTTNEVGIATPSTIGNLIANTTQVGYMDMPPNAQTGATYTLALTDRGKLVQINGASQPNIVIPANASVAFPNGTVIMIQNSSGASNTISITTDTLQWLPSAATGTRTLAFRGLATLYKISSTVWYIWGFGIT